MSDLDDILFQIDGAMPASIERLFEILRIPSVSTDPAYGEECKKAARWVAETIAGAGFHSAVYPTPGQSMVVGHYRREGKAEGKRPHVLFYGHYDVQPADPLELWEKPPFEPYLSGRGDDARIVGRGASDDKGQFMTFFEACRAMIELRGELPVDVTVLIEGEEESGSPSLEPFIEARADELKADLALVCDTAMWNPKTPAISTRLRGLVADEVVITGPSRDLHSGFYGGAALNPITVLVDVLASLHAGDGRVAVEGFYDGVGVLPEKVRSAWNGLGFNESRFLGDIGLKEGAGEAGFSVLESIWARPTLDINGIVGGYTGEGGKTVIPSQASAKITCRLVGDQDPDKIREAIRNHIRARLPGDAKVVFGGGHGAPAVEMASEAPAFRRTARALMEEWGHETAMIGCGGSIPIVENFRRQLGMETILVGFALEDDNIHSPNEKYDVRSFQKGIRSWARILDALAAG